MAKTNKPQARPTATVPYSLSTIPTEEMANLLSVLFSQTEWHDMMARRNKFCKMFLRFKTGTAEANSAYKQIVDIDNKASRLVFSAMVNYAVQHDKEHSSRTITLAEYFKEFVKTQEQEDLYQAFHSKLQVADFLADILDTVITDSKELLKQLDPTVLLSEFDALKEITKILKSYSDLRHRKEHPELMDCYANWSDDITNAVYVKSMQFLKEYSETRKSLESRGELKSNSNDKK